MASLILQAGYSHQLFPVHGHNRTLRVQVLLQERDTLFPGAHDRIKLPLKRLHRRFRLLHEDILQAIQYIFR